MNIIRYGGLMKRNKSMDDGQFPSDSNNEEHDWKFWFIQVA